MGDQELSALPPPSDTELTAEQKLYWLNALQIVDDWTVHDDGAGRLFYYDRRTDSSQWEVPDGLASLETEFMMKLMLQNAVARSGVWTAHDAGNGTLYYFNSKTRVSVWERPSEWGEQEAVAAAEAREREAMADLEKEKKEKQEQEADKAAKKVKKKEKKHKKHKKKKAERDDEAGAKEKGDGKEGKKEDPTPHQEVEEEEPLTAEEMQEELERKARELKRIEQFRAMLRDKNIMPFCKWSVALPQIAGDPRFMGVPTMDERRAIFEHFVEHRREDLKAEKKSKLKQAKQVFTQLLKEQFQLDSWDPKTTLGVFISTLEDQLRPDHYKQVQDDALALLTLSAQEKIYAKAVAEYKTEALKRDGEQLRLTKFLEDKLATHDTSTVHWESDKVQKFVQEFYSSAESAALLPAQKQQQVFEELVARISRGREPSRDKGEKKRPERPRSPPRDRVSSNNDHKRQDPSPRRKSRHSHHDRHRSRSRSRRRRSRSNSRSRSRGRERGHRSRGSSRRRSASSSRSRSHSQEERSSRRSSSRYHRHHSSSPSRSRSRTRW